MTVLSTRPKPFDPDDLESLPVVHLMSAGAPIYAGQLNRVWRALVQTPGSVDSALPVVLKFMPSNVKVSIELGCSLASAVIGLPVPRGMVVLANPDELVGLPQQARPLPGRSEVLCYASVLRWPDDTAERALADDPAVTDFLWRRFCDTKLASPSAAWDELVANADRHTKNFVFDGARYWLIDHELSLRPISESIQRMTETAGRLSLVDHKADDNKVAHQLLQRRPADHGMLQQPKGFESRKQSLELLATRMAAWRTGDAALDAVLQDAETVLRGIILRLPALGLHLTDRISSPAGPLKWTPSVG